jgi:hypothetical protein
MSADGKTLVAILVGQNEDERRGERRREGPVGVQGELKSFDLKARTLTLLLNRERREVEETFPLAPNVTFAQGRNQGPLEDANLKPGMRLALMLGDDRKTVAAIQLVAAEGDRRRVEERDRALRRGGLALRGAVKSIDPATKTLTLTVLQEGIELTGVFTLTDTTAVHAGREQGQLADLKPGVPVVVQFAEDKKTVVSVQIIVGERR